MKKRSILVIASLLALAMAACAADTTVDDADPQTTASTEQAEEPADLTPESSDKADEPDQPEPDLPPTASGTIHMPDGFPSNEGDAVYFLPPSDDYFMEFREYERNSTVYLFCYGEGEQPIYAVTKYIYGSSEAAQEIMAGILDKTIPMENMDHDDTVELVDNVIFHVYSDPSRGPERPNYNYRTNSETFYGPQAE